MMDEFSELCSPCLKGSTSAFIAGTASRIFVQIEIPVTQITMAQMGQIERK